MRQAIVTLKLVPERIWRAGCVFASRCRLRIVAISCVLAAWAILTPELVHAGIVTEFTARPHCQVFDGFDVSLGDDSLGTAAPATSDERSTPGNQPADDSENKEVPKNDSGFDLAGGGTTSAPASPVGPVAPAILATASFKVAASIAVRRIRILQDLAVDSPAPLGLLDPPKA